ncbi:zinc-dependent alcohol dehydrogenase [Cellulomonas fengjieae]|uniref:Glutathione-dependent formaldehyde dehydrogenase n=1 Tax=Cellulomonas fengjieae TaxID=2819978 RepID=A0ABS3SIS7_9CELL|nr:zinc-dependent alcohol dehydrogenase [Cellulomonas fengjieae]MBO3085650.1 glutathione-dependent formaldehyde dehydrogenase [Cellulomonas fengjieae]QVI67635.1 glutathione-dependent formaldehyde dehydrogenase [Cellulomonas fengjieae]
MHALTWQGREKVSVDEVPDPSIQEPTDAIIRVTSTAICGSDLHLYAVLGAFLDAGDILGHEAMGVVEEVGSAAGSLRVGDRVVVPFGIACGTCWMCTRGLYSQCETTQVREQGKGAALFGYTKLYGQVPGGQAQYLRVPQAQFGPVVVPDDGSPDERYLYLSDVLPTAWQAVEYAQVPAGGTVGVLGLGPIGQMSARIAAHRGASRVIGIDRVPERLAMARRHGIDVIDLRETKDLVAAVLDLTDGRGVDAAIDAVGMEAHGSPAASVVQRAATFLPDALATPVIEKAGIDRLAALQSAIAIARRGGTVSISGVYGGAVDPLPMMTMFDKGLTLRMGQANVRRWIDDLLPLVTDDADPLGVLDLRTHRLPLREAPAAYEMFQKKHDGCIKVVLDPQAG